MTPNMSRSFRLALLELINLKNYRDPTFSQLEALKEACLCDYLSIVQFVELPPLYFQCVTQTVLSDFLFPIEVSKMRRCLLLFLTFWCGTYSRGIFFVTKGTFGQLTCEWQYLFEEFTKDPTIVENRRLRIEAKVQNLSRLNSRWGDTFFPLLWPF